MTIFHNEVAVSGATSPTLIPFQRGAVPAPQWPDSAPDSRGSGLTGSRPPKAAMLVAQRIVRDIGRAGLRPGDLLPPERAMLETWPARSNC